MVNRKTLDILQKEKGLTITCDGLSTRSANSAYTTHATTQNCDIYLLDAHNGSNQHHTAEYVQDVVDKVRVSA